MEYGFLSTRTESGTGKGQTHRVIIRTLEANTAQQDSGFPKAFCEVSTFVGS